MYVGVRSALFASMATIFAACSGAGDDHPANIGSEGQLATGASADGGSDPTQSATQTCVSFEKRECVIDLGLVNGVHNCTKGVQVCERGSWTECASLDY